MKNKILFIKPAESNPKFITNDIEFLKSKYILTEYDVKTKKSVLIFSLVKQYIYLLFNIYRFNLIYIWFADYHSFLPVLSSKIFHKKTILCAGGYEATFIAEINCGVFTNATLLKRIRRFAATFSLKNSHYVLPVDESLIENVNTYVYSDIPGKEPLKDGIKHFIPEIKSEIIAVHPGYDENIFKKSENIKKEHSVISAGLIMNENEYKRKGFDMLVEAAKILTDTKFVLIGLSEFYFEKLKSLNLSNLVLFNIIPYNQLIEEYSKAKVYAQLSLFEGLPSTICEAMCCECIPVGSNVNGIPRIIGDTGYIVYKKDIKEIVKNIKLALDSNDSLGKKARENIINNFSIKKREDKILSITESLLSSHILKK